MVVGLIDYNWFSRAKKKVAALLNATTKLEKDKKCKHFLIFNGNYLK